MAGRQTSILPAGFAVPRGGTSYEKLATLVSMVNDLRWPKCTAVTTRAMLLSMLTHMAEIDKIVAERPDGRPTARDYDDLWDTIVDDITALGEAR